jgi:hypothetical protein
MSLRMLSLAILLSVLPARSQAFADPRWTFCVATESGTKDVWITDVFSATADRERLETGFKNLLERQGHPHIVAQCPLPAEDKVATVNAQTTAEEFNRKLGAVLHSVPAHDFPVRQ